MKTPRLSRVSKIFMGCFKNYFQAKNVLLIFMSVSLYHMWFYNYSKNVLMWNILFYQLVLSVIHYKYCVNMSIDLGDYVYESLERAVFLAPYGPQRFSGSEYDSHDEETDGDEETERTDNVKSEWCGKYKKFSSSEESDTSEESNASESGSDASESDSDASENESDSDASESDTKEINPDEVYWSNKAIKERGFDPRTGKKLVDTSENNGNDDNEEKSEEPYYLLYDEHSDVIPLDKGKDESTHPMTTRSKSKDNADVNKVDDTDDDDYVKVGRFSGWFPWSSNSKFKL